MNHQQAQSLLNLAINTLSDEWGIPALVSDQHGGDVYQLVFPRVGVGGAYKVASYDRAYQFILTHQELPPTVVMPVTRQLAPTIRRPVLSAQDEAAIVRAIRGPRHAPIAAAIAATIAALCASIARATHVIGATLAGMFQQASARPSDDHTDRGSASGKTAAALSTGRRYRQYRSIHYRIAASPKR